MLYTVLVAFATYYLILFAVGVLVKAIAIEGELIAFAAICFIGAYLVRNYSRFVFRLALGAGIAVTVLLVGIWGLLPILSSSGHTWVLIIAVVTGLVMYFYTRPRIYRHYTRRDPVTRIQVAPPFGREWCRWLFIILM